MTVVAQGAHWRTKGKFLESSPSASPCSSCRLPACTSSRAVSSSSFSPSDYSIPNPVPSSPPLSSRNCIPCQSGGLTPMGEEEAQEMLQQLPPGWAIVRESAAGPSSSSTSSLRLRREWVARSFLSALELFSRVAAVAEEEGHHPDLHLERWNKARLELWTHSIGGLHSNDFILAAKISALDVSDLVKRPKAASATSS